MHDRSTAGGAARLTPHTLREHGRTFRLGLLHRAWPAVQRLGPLAHSDRRPFLSLVDECHRFCHLPQGIASALAQARGYGLGFVLAHQHLAQVADHGLLEAIDANCQTKICFALQAADARRLWRRTSSRA